MKFSLNNRKYVLVCVTLFVAFLSAALGKADQFVEISTPVLTLVLGYCGINVGQKIFTKKCKKDIDLNSYIEINELKASIKNNKLCGELKEKHLQALSLYLWEVKRFGDLATIKDSIHVTKDEKCPICGMFVYKYPRWATQIFYGEDKHYSFDGVKDMMKYYFEHKKGISKMLVLDYYSQKAIDASKAYYVIGSDIYGPMGNELIAFKNESSAKTFYMDHRAKKIVNFKDITQDEVYKLDE